MNFDKILNRGEMQYKTLETNVKFKYEHYKKIISLN